MLNTLFKTNKIISLKIRKTVLKKKRAVVNTFKKNKNFGTSNSFLNNNFNHDDIYFVDSLTYKRPHNGIFPVKVISKPRSLAEYFIRKKTFQKKKQFALLDMAVVVVKRTFILIIIVGALVAQASFVSGYEAHAINVMAKIYGLSEDSAFVPINSSLPIPTEESVINFAEDADRSGSGAGDCAGGVVEASDGAEPGSKDSGEDSGGVASLDLCSSAPTIEGSDLLENGNTADAAGPSKSPSVAKPVQDPVLPELSPVAEVPSATPSPELSTFPSPALSPLPENTLTESSNIIVDPAEDNIDSMGYSDSGKKGVSQNTAIKDNSASTLSEPAAAGSIQN